MFQQLTSRLEEAFKKLRGESRLTPENIKDALREVRRALLEADVHFQVARDFTAKVEARASGQEVLKGLSPGQQVVRVVHEELMSMLGGKAHPLPLAPTPPTTWMMVGLQGSGKTTFTGKLARYMKEKQRRVLMAACDLARPAAMDQLATLGRQLGVEVFVDRTATHPREVASRAFDRARAGSFDVLLLDTAGRLHVDEALMLELRELKDEAKPHQTLLVVDAMTGQEAVNVATSFRDGVDFDALVLSKVDGDARGGAALSIRAVTGRPIQFLSSGEKLDAMELFHPDRVASRILGMGDVLTLVERAENAVEMEQAAAMAEKLRRETFTFEDFLEQLQAVKKMGPLGEVLRMIPGVSAKLPDDVEVDESGLKRVEAIIRSMTPRERHQPKIIDGSRRKRIARGSGTSVQEVNQLLRQFTDMQKMMRQMKKMGRGRLPAFR
ncbi:MAG: signal recognition particle protein [Candidatus Eisenbacteria bacterium]|nr:signal recognition particle protein [Candidatus Eisenbacteria bacterium]